jgi:hypothetical protein
MGRDFFFFWITKTGIYPYGSFEGATCDINGGTDMLKSQGCAAKVLNDGAMNY